MNDKETDFIVIKEEGSSPIKAWIRGVPVEEEALQQLKNIASLPFVQPHVAVMPDVHLGKGATVGSVIPTLGAIVPAAVGVDIGCGMRAVRLSLKHEDLPDSLSTVRSMIEAAVPHGRTDNGGRNDKGSWNEVHPLVRTAWENLSVEYNNLINEHRKLDHHRAVGQLGTLGTGNHFIEVCLGSDGHVWVVLHSGSRGPGNKIGTYFINLAKKEMEKYFIKLPDKDLAYLPSDTDHFDSYMKSLQWAQKYALTNRELMMALVLNALHSNNKIPSFSVDQLIDCHHNYTERENHFGKNVWVTRKGAVRARENDMGIIPGSMGDRSYIVKGKGNPFSLCSCSHGAGRKMSRSKAKKLFSLEDHKKSTEGVECRKDADVIDETPGAYKNIDDVMNAQRNLVDVVCTLKQVVCVKG